MIYVGIDVAKLNHFASLISSDGEILVGPFQFSNDGDGFQYLVSAFEPFDDEEIIIGLESTARYADNLIRYLVAEGYNVCVLNPISTSSMRKNNIRKTKTDRIDTYIIAQTLMMQKSYRFVTFEDLDLMNLKELGRFRQKTVKQRTRLKIQLTSYVDQTFPELQYFFKSGLHQKSVYALLKEAPTAKSIASMHLTHLAPSPCEDFPRSFQKGTGGRIKSSGTEVGRSIRPGAVHPDHFCDCSDRASGCSDCPSGGWNDRYHAFQ